MKHQPGGIHAIALAILVVWLFALGVSAQTLLIAALVLACPLMMLFMHGGHGAGARPADHHDASTATSPRQAISGLLRYRAARLC